MQQETEAESMCPCESGYHYSKCCGIDNRTSLNLVARITTTGLESVNSAVTPQMKHAISAFTHRPDLFPARIQFFDNNVQLVKMSLRWYQESVFLDPARLRGSCTIESDIEWFQTASDAVPWRTSAYIFHTAFCGSTLMSKALDAIYETVPIREPEVLGNLLVYLRSRQHSQETIDAWVSRVMRTLSRCYTENQVAVIKANDYANPIMLNFLQSQPASPVLFMYTPLNEFVAGCLKAESRKQWIAQRFNIVSQFAAIRFNRFEDIEIFPHEYGKMAAVYWSYNIALYLDAFKDRANKLKSLIFGDMLAKPDESIDAVATVFDLHLRDGVDRAKSISEMLGVYSKNADFKYSPQKRQHDIKNLLNKFNTDARAADDVAHQLLGAHYPADRLPGNVLQND